LQPQLKQYRDDGLQYVLITDDSKETILHAVGQDLTDIVVLSDPNNTIASQLGVEGWPTGMLFSREGHLVNKTIGWKADGSLQAWKSEVEAELHK